MSSSVPCMTSTGALTFGARMSLGNGFTCFFTQFDSCILQQFIGGFQDDSCDIYASCEFHSCNCSNTVSKEDDAVWRQVEFRQQELIGGVVVGVHALLTRRASTFAETRVVFNTDCAKYTEEVQCVTKVARVAMGIQNGEWSILRLSYVSNSHSILGFRSQYFETLDLLLGIVGQLNVTPQIPLSLMHFLTIDDQHGGILDLDFQNIEDIKSKKPIEGHSIPFDIQPLNEPVP
ncbi:unnamed protein product [Notodromas monacha]|uniref:Uncharacterized protein n=1 Tax=Notodromas monacha TaxID=399045 RepID=A0A7R9BTL3_9CRUS|nr:unnamed protein product [Notodromas monacha]CAG0921191.1 unnamed protein product [Notodromas monacha]